MTLDPSPALGTTRLRAYLQQHPRSPLAGRYALALVEAGEYDAALRLCRSALEYYPGFATLHYIVAMAQTAKQQYLPARKRLQQLLEEHPACDAARQLLKRIEKYERQSLLEGGVENRGIPDADISFPDYDEKDKKSNWSWSEHLIPGQEVILSKRAKDFHLEETQDDPMTAGREEAKASIDLKRKPKPFTESIPGTVLQEELARDLEKLADQLDMATMPRISSDVAGEEEQAADSSDAVNIESRQVTETLAEIYVGQGKYNEAIDAYRKLRDKHRDRRYEFTVRISEIKRLIDKGNSPDDEQN
jgi:tetratricopeptide (TPR) repeat protein